MGKKLVIFGANFSKNGIVPEFAALSWIGGSNANNSFISSGIKLDTDTELEFTVELDSSKLNSTANGACYGLGSYENINSMCYVWFLRDRTDLNFGKKDVHFSFSSWNSGAHTVILNKNGVSLDGDLRTFDTATDVTYGQGPIYLDCTQKASGNYFIDGNSAAMKISSVIIRKSGVVVADFKPFKRIKDGAVGFYDSVNGVFVTRNDGSTPTYGE